MHRDRGNLHWKKKWSQNGAFRGTVFVRRTDPFVALFWLLFFLSGAIFPKKRLKRKNGSSLQKGTILVPLEAPFWTLFVRRGAIFPNGSSEAPVWLHFFSQCMRDSVQIICPYCSLMHEIGEWHTPHSPQWWSLYRNTILDQIRLWAVIDRNCNTFFPSLQNIYPQEKFRWSIYLQKQCCLLNFTPKYWV